MNLEFEHKFIGESIHFNQYEILRKGLPCGILSLDKNLKIEEYLAAVYK